MGARDFPLDLSVDDRTDFRTRALIDKLVATLVSVGLDRETELERLRALIREVSTGKLES